MGSEKDLKPVRTETDYERVLALIDELLVLDPSPGSESADRLEALTVLVQAYESQHFPRTIPNPIAAIRFRMDQLGLGQKDLVPILGSRGRVSEILSGKRSLTLSMIRALHQQLRIPAAVLLTNEQVEEPHREPHGIPHRELIRRGWIDSAAARSSEALRQALEQFLQPLTRVDDGTVFTKTSSHVRSTKPVRLGILRAWLARAAGIAEQTRVVGHFDRQAFTREVLSGLAHLSILDKGPIYAQEYLARYGVTLVTVEHLTGTYLDGAAFLLEHHRPVIALTLRYDRLDNFWFTLYHEMGHVILHLSSGHIEGFFDDLDTVDDDDPREREADDFALDALIPNDIWQTSSIGHTPNAAYARQLAQKLGISPSIVAGRARRSFGAYQALTHLVGHGEVRRLFWPQPLRSEQ